MSEDLKPANVSNVEWALFSIAGWSKCQCDQRHGDNPNCPVLVAENALEAQSCE